MKRYDAAERPPFRSFVGGNVTLLFCKKSSFWYICMCAERPFNLLQHIHSGRRALIRQQILHSCLYISSGVHALCVCVCIQHITTKTIQTDISYPTEDNEQKGRIKRKRKKNKKRSKRTTLANVPHFALCRPMTFCTTHLCSRQFFFFFFLGEGCTL